MTEDFELNKQKLESSSVRAEPNTLGSLLYDAKVGSSMLGTLAPCAWPQDSGILQAQRRSSLALGGGGIMSFPNSRRNSLGLGGDFSFAAGSRRNSLALGLDLGLTNQQQFNNDVAALASQAPGSQSLLTSGLGTPTNAQRQISALHGGDISLQHQQLLLQQHQQQQQMQQQAMAMVERSSDAKRVQAEAQAAAAALFLGAPLPGNEESAANNFGHQGRTDAMSALSSQQLLGTTGIGALANSPSSLQTSQQLLQRSAATNTSRDVLSMGLNLGDADIGNVSSSDSSLHQLQQLQLQQRQLQQKQQQLQLLQSSLSPQLQMQSQQQKQLQQLQLQQQLRQQEMRRHSLNLSLPFDSPGSSQHQQLTVKELKLSEQCRLYQQLDSNAGGDQAALFGAMSGNNREQLVSPEQLSNKRAKADSKQSSVGLQNPSKGAASKKDASFPQKLHEILSNPEYNEMIAWMPHGKSWRILKPSAFENVVIPLHFRHSKYASFMRQVNGWGFQRVLHGNDHNSYKHDLFVQDQPELCKKMKRIGTVKKAKEAAEAESASQEKGADSSREDSKRASFSSGTSPANVSKVRGIATNLTNALMSNASLLDDGALQGFGGNDVNSISAARSALSSKFAASIGNLDRHAVAQNQVNNDFSQLFHGASSLEMSVNGVGLGQLGNRQSQNLMKLTSPDLISGKLPQQQQNLSSASAAGGLDFLQQQLAFGTTSEFSQQQQQQQSGTSLSKRGVSGLSGVASLQGLGNQQGDASDPFNPQFQASLTSNSGSASSRLNNDNNRNVEI